ncbi:MAG TPA: glutathione transferase GstA [Allosphingosinicella sp.]|jgi:glutathione S-transferase|nr:glutathione transferase GstA [Allosphingosinicella sp.]
MRLYYTPGTCSLATHIAAREARIDVELVKVDLATKLTADGGRYAAINPLGYVPALVLDGGEVLTEASAVLQYLADIRPESGLLPAAGTFERYVAQQWLAFVATELHKGFAPLWKKETPPDVRRQTVETLATRFAFLDQHLAGRRFLLGERFSVADAYAFAVLGWARLMSIDLARWPNLTAFVERVEARPKVREALALEGLLPSAEAA